MRSNKGFTLIELMIVVAIIAIISAITIPNLLRARLASNESSAIGALRTISSAQSNFKKSTGADADSDGTGEFASLAQLSNATPPYIDSALGAGKKLGYYFTITLPGDSNTDEVRWAAQANPITYQQTGNRTFYIDESGILRGSDTGSGSGVTRAEAAPVNNVGGWPKVGN